MLDLLIRYANNHGLTTEPGFKPKRAVFAILFDNRGQYAGVLPLRPSPKEKGRRFDKCPHLEQPEIKRGGKGCRHFLLDNALTVTLFGEHQKPTPKAADQHCYFTRLLRDAAVSCSYLAKIADALDDQVILEKVNTELDKHKVNTNDKITIAISDPLRFVVELDEWHAWWKNFRRGFVESSHCSMLCFVTGQSVKPVKTHQVITGLGNVGGQKSGDRLVSFKQSAFQSYRMDQSENAAVSDETATAYRAALEELLEFHSHKLAGVKIIHWFSGEEDVRPEDDPFEMLNVPVAPKTDDKSDSTTEAVAQSRAGKLLDSIRTGNRADLLRYRFYVLTLSGNSGRVVIRDWMEGQFGDLARSVDQWFGDLEISNLSGEKPANPPKLERVVTCLLPEMKQGQKYDDWVKPIGSDRLALWKAAVDRNRAISNTTATRVLLQHANYVLRGDWERMIDPKERSRILLLSLLYARMGLLKMFLIRKGDADMSCYLNEDHPDPAYHCGRLMAILADVQLAALPDVKAGVVQRYYAAASATPALVLGRLIRTAQFHLDKVRSERPKLAYWFDEQLASIACRLNPEALPTTLTLQQQCLFALGYYQQKAGRKHDEKTESANSAADSN